MFRRRFAGRHRIWCGAQRAGRATRVLGKLLLTMSGPETTTLFETSAAVSSAVKAMPRADAKPQTPRALPPAARDVAAQGFRHAYSPIVLAGAVRAIEVVLVVTVGLLLYLGYVVPDNGFNRYYFAAIAGIALLALLAFQAADIYQVQAFRGHEKQYMRLASAWSMVFLLVIGASFFAKAGDMFSRLWLGTFYVSGLVALIISRRLVFLLVRHWTRDGRLTRRTVIVGGGQPGAHVIEELRRQKDAGVSIIGLFDDRGDERGGSECAGQRKLGTVEDLVAFGRRTRVDLVIFSLPISAENRILEMLKKLWVLPVDIRLAAHANKLTFRPRSYSYIGKVPMIDVADRPIADWDVVMKWLFDKLVGGAMLLCALPAMALIALAIKLDSRGPVLFKQKRYGFNNDLIEVYKFRSMYVEKTDANASKLVTKDDPRVTRVGRIIRKTSLDELPQLFNVVLKGNLSLVGPRPHAVNAKAEARLYDEAVDGYFARHRVKPGITGWAQINGWRGETDTHEKIQQRVEHDLYYIENWSLLFDLFILARTPLALLKTENAY